MSEDLGRSQHGEFGLPDLIARSGQAGRRFEEEYRSLACRQIRWGFQRALDLFRRLGTEEGYLQLERARARLEELGDGISAPVRYILIREHASILAYYFYLQEDLERAEELLAVAQEAVQKAIEIQPCLLLQARHSLEYCYQRARIARSCRRWDEMRRVLETAHGMVEDQVPLCVLGDGTPILFATLDDHLRSLSCLDPRELAYVRQLSDRQRRRHEVERFSEYLYLIPGVVIPFF